MAWGGYKNGQIPADALASIPAQIGPFLEPHAEAQAELLQQAFLAHFGIALVIVEGYRNLQRQQYLYNGWIKGLPGFNLAAVPGTSNHGWALACDFGSGVNTFGDVHKVWMDANAPAFGWFPAGNSFSPPEAWHFEYRGGATITTASQITAAASSAALTSEEDDMDATQAQQLQFIYNILASDTIDGTAGGMRAVLVDARAKAAQIQAILATDENGGMRAVLKDALAEATAAKASADNLTAIVATDTVTVGGVAVKGGLRGMVASVAAALQKASGTAPASLSTATDAELAAELLTRLKG